MPKSMRSGIYAPSNRKFVANLQQTQQFVTKTPNKRCFSQKALAY